MSTHRCGIIEIKYTQMWDHRDVSTHRCGIIEIKYTQM